MSLGHTLFVFGVLLTLAPVLLSPNNLLDYIAWLAKQPLIRHLQFRYCVLSGMLIAAGGAIMSAMDR